MHFLEWKYMNFILNFTDFCSQVWINNIPALVQIMAWHLPGDKPLSEPVMVILLMPICVTWPQWFKKGPVMQESFLCDDVIRNCFSPITCCLVPRARRARASQMTISPLTGGPQPWKSGWSIVEISNSGHTCNFAHNENTFCTMPYHNLVEIKPCVLM